MRRSLRSSCALGQHRPLHRELPARLVIIDARPRVVDRRLDLCPEPVVVGHRLVRTLHALGCDGAALVGGVLCAGTGLELGGVDPVLGDAEILEKIISSEKIIYLDAIRDAERRMPLSRTLVR